MVAPPTDEPNELEMSEAAGHRPRLSRHWLACLALLVAAVGLTLVVVGYSMPAYTDPVAAERIKSGQECERGIPNTNEDLRCDTERWHRSIRALRTIKWDLIDGGEGLLLSGLTIGGFFWWTRKKPWGQLLTPRNGLSILALAALSWFIQIPAYGLLFVTELTRGYYPHWADTIAIPILRFQSFLLGMFLPYMAIWLLFVVGARLPAPVLSAIPGRPLVNAFWTGVTGLMLVLIALALIGAILEGPTLMVPFLWLTLWLTLCARAAALTRHRRRA
jgi:hypothetical protein